MFDNNLYITEYSIKEYKNDAKKAMFGLYHHMLKWDHQRHIQSPNWEDSINKEANKILKLIENTNIRKECIENEQKIYDKALEETKNIAHTKNEYFTSKMNRNIPKEYRLDYILDENNRYKWIHSRCGNAFLKTHKRYKNDIIKETDVRINPMNAIE